LKQYEAMFLFDSTFASDYANVEKELARLMERAGAEIIVAGKWDERKLAYEIKKHKRGSYVLVFFRSPGDSIRKLEQDCRLSEHVLRVLILSAEDLSRKKIDEMIAHQPPPASAGGWERPGRSQGRPRSSGSGPRPSPTEKPVDKGAVEASAVATLPDAPPVTATATATEPPSGTEPEDPSPAGDDSAVST